MICRPRQLGPPCMRSGKTKPLNDPPKKRTKLYNFRTARRGPACLVGLWRASGAPPVCIVSCRSGVALGRTSGSKLKKIQKSRFLAPWPWPMFFWSQLLQERCARSLGGGIYPYFDVPYTLVVSISSGLGCPSYYFLLQKVKGRRAAGAPGAKSDEKSWFLHTKRYVFCARSALSPVKHI